MRFSIVGAGALGTILGACLIDCGHEVRMLARGRRAEHIARYGLRVTGLRELELPCDPIAALDPDIDNGTVVYAVKTYHMDAALPPAGSIAPQAVFSMANGVMKQSQLEKAFGPDRVLGCMANFSGELLSDGSVNFTRNVCLYLGGREPYTGEVVAAINDSGIVAAVSDSIETVEWSKFVGWVAFFSLSLMARTSSGIFLQNARFATVGAAIVREAAAVAAARGIKLVDLSPLPVDSVATLPEAAAVEKIREVGAQMHENAPGHRMSSLQDLEAGRMLEVHETIGYLVREAHREHIEVPTLELCYNITAGLNDLQT